MRPPSLCGRSQNVEGLNDPVWVLKPPGIAHLEIKRTSGEEPFFGCTLPPQGDQSLAER
jgi:hypothetical protein